MKCSGFADSKRFRCQNLVSKERQDLGKITCRIHDDDETEGLLYSGDRGDDEALTRYWLPLKSSQSSQSSQPAEGSSARHALKLMFGGKDRKLTDLLAISGLFGAMFIFAAVTLSYKILGFGWQPVFTDVGELSSKVVGTVLFAGVALYLVANLAQRFGRKVDLAKEGLETRQADRDRHSDAVAVMRRDGDFHAEIYGEFLKDRSEFNVSVNRPKRTCLSLRRRAIRLGKHAGELEFRSKNPFIEKRTRLRIRRTILSLQRGCQRREDEAADLATRNGLKLRQSALFSQLLSEEHKVRSATMEVKKAEAELDRAKKAFESDVSSTKFYKTI